MEDANPILPTTHGYIKGVRRTTVYEQTYYSFEKIPYAKPPLGALRFRAPQPGEPWAHVLDCLQFADKPLQKNIFTGQIEGSEDCLYLNVYVKKLQTHQPLPVLVYIYGGAFQNGEATRDVLSPDYFMEEDIVLVTLNYRLGPLGFLTLTDPTLKVPGNAGLKDQLAALRWFNKNCINFNGNPNNITLFGNSAGGASVHYLMLVPQSKGLFHKAILQSGTVFNKWAHVPHGDYAYRLAKLCGYAGANDDRQVCDYLLKADASQLVGHELMTDEERFNEISYVFGPSVETFKGDDCLVATDPQQMLNNSWSNKIPVLIGGTSFEGLLRYPRVKANPGFIALLQARPELAVPADVRERLGAETSRQRGREIIQMHFGAAEMSIENILKYLDIFSYKNFWLGFVRSVRARHAQQAGPTYLYRFDFDSPTFNLSRLKFCGPDVRGVSHADELSYLFYGLHARKLAADSAEYRTIRCLVGMWTAFATTSNPNCAEIAPTRWLPTAAAAPNQCLNISNNVEMLELPEAEKLNVWLQLYEG